MRYARFFGFVLGLILLAFTPQTAAAQTSTGTISGTVRDTTGAVVPGASVSAKNSATSVERATQTDTTGLQGVYTIPGLLPGTYDLTGALSLAWLETDPNLEEV